MATIEFAEQPARSVHELIAERLLRPAVTQLAAQGLNDLSIVLSADLHLLPYHEVLEATLAETGCALSVYPSCGTWARHHAPGAGTPPRPQVPAWAVVGHAALDSSAPLHWVALEQRLTLRLWGESMLPVKTLSADALHADGVTALIGMGHGSAPASNPARAGLLVGADRVLSAHDLPRIRTCHRVILSCCVLGRVDEVHTEAMGFLSSSFGYSTRFGAGWIVEVPDAEACMFNITFQFALRHAHNGAQPGQTVGWNDVFHTVLRGIREGRWPAGLGAWLSSHCRLPSRKVLCPAAPGSTATSTCATSMAACSSLRPRASDGSCPGR